ncbi:uncharacterized protein LOC125315986 [Rhodamnia argentea]|uniref:Uncharacterized protein LOC125315986 n=1 Tax=Rhodamnia argentea TaxID=178133 RepID=A0ABM3HPR2_9MYRT|nr:uncharacterized protein LOC125315986 [Rhodamnia argentea]
MGAVNGSCVASKCEQTAGARKDLYGDEEGCREHARHGHRHGCTNCKIVINGREDKIDLAVLPMYDLDVIIGMDWLGKLGAVVDRGSRTIQFNPIGRPRFKFVGSRGGTSIPLVSSLEVTKLIDEGCEAYLAVVMDSTIEEPKFEDIPVVREFPDVFPQDLLGLPPEREKEFSIELINGVEPISKAPYRMSISELKELKVRMHELLDKGFTHPSASPWGVPVLFDGTKVLQSAGTNLRKIVETKADKRRPEFRVSEDGIFKFGGRLCVPNDGELKEKILSEAHRSNYGIHPGSMKMYQNLRQHYWWNGMKVDVARHVAKCLTCRQVKTQHCKPGGMLQPLEIPEWKWEHVTTNFVMGLPRSQRGDDSIWFIVDRLTKSAHFLAVRKNFAMDRCAELYMRQIVRLYGVPVTITLDRDPKFTASLWKSL